MSRIKRNNRRLQRGPPTGDSPKTFRLVVISTLGFFFLCVLVACICFADDLKPKATTVSKHDSSMIFKNPSELQSDLIKSLELILILGGGSPSSLESPPLYVQRRCDDAASIVRRRQETNQQIKGRTDDTIPILCLSAGTAHAPQLMGADGVPIWESTASAAYLMKEHSNLIHSRNVYVETTSYDTIGNAYFTRTSHTDINGWRNILIITSEVRELLLKINVICLFYYACAMLAHKFCTIISFTWQEPRLYLTGSLELTRRDTNSTICLRQMLVYHQMPSRHAKKKRRKV